MNNRFHGLSWLFLGAAVLLPGFTASLGAADGTYNVTETWSATLTYSGWGDKRFTGTRQFSGKQTGTIVLHGGRYTLLNQTGLKHDPPVDTERTMRFDGSRYSIQGGRVMPYILAGSSLNAVLHLSGFMVKVPLVDGEIPTFNWFDPYHTSGPNLASLSASGDMRGGSLTIAVSSTSSWVRAPFAPVIQIEPEDQTVFAGLDATFRVVADGNPSPSYQWQHKRHGSSRWNNLSDGATHTGTRTSILTVKQTAIAMTGDLFRCSISNSRGTVTTSAVELTVGPALVAPEILARPQSRSISANWQTIEFSVEATGSEPLEFQWRFQGDDIAGATTPLLTIENVAAWHAGQYDVVVSNPAGSAISQPAVLTFEVPVVASGIRLGPDGFRVTLAFGVGDTIELDESPDLVRWHSLGFVTSPDGIADYLWQRSDVDAIGFLRARQTHDGIRD